MKSLLLHIQTVVLAALAMHQLSTTTNAVIATSSPRNITGPFIPLRKMCATGKHNAPSGEYLRSLLGDRYVNGTADPSDIDDILANTGAPSGHSLRKRSERRNLLEDYVFTGPITIPVVYHVVCSPVAMLDRFCVGNRSLADATQVLNEAYKPHGIQFQTVRVNRVRRGGFYGQPMQKPNGDDLSDKFMQLMVDSREGGANTMNVVLNRFNSDGVLGLTTVFPNELMKDPNLLAIDGIFIDVRALRMFPDELRGGLQAYNGGKTLVHEAGHWLGLYHVFQGGCNGHDIFVGADDTPAVVDYSNFPVEQKLKFFQCNRPRSCPDKGGDEPTSNFMDYTPDSCITQFTAGQIRQIRLFWRVARSKGSIKLRPAETEGTPATPTPSPVPDSDPSPEDVNSNKIDPINANVHMGEPIAINNSTGAPTPS